MYEVPASKASIKQNVFEFKVPGTKKTWSIPKQAYINSELLGRFQAEAIVLKPIVEAGGKPTPEQAIALMTIQQEIFDHYCPGVRALVDSEQLAQLFRAWQEASAQGQQGVQLGES
ncbi:hypothetical protein [Herbiconiux solani]|uniref:hypothetical protein n=1 Tax=Herbiconiux solani TaxID=661329 RepID=UPI000826E0E2|nr:hypothetical protein [Herbiconiux solani]